MRNTYAVWSWFSIKYSVFNFYKLKESSEVSIHLYNVLGEEISILYQGNKEAGMQQEEFELSNLRLKAGTYIVRISTKEGIKTLRLVKI